MVKLILDTDIGGDCDDAGAMAVMHGLAKLGLCDILAVTSCTSKISGAACVEIINRYYGRTDIPVGMLEQEGFNVDHDTYASVLEREFDHPYKEGQQPESAVRVMRSVLAAHEGVVICGIGPQLNIRNLLASPPDDLSDLSGYELVRDKVSALYLMGAYFEETSFPYFFGEHKLMAEWNIEQDVAAAQYVSARWPGRVVYVPFEIGAVVQTGQPLFQYDDKLNPVTRAYEAHVGGTRESWDPITVLCAVDPARAAQYMEFEAGCEITFDERGVSSCRKAGGRGLHSYAKRVTKPVELAELVNGLMVVGR